jgi:hypothetical protein
MLLGYIQLRPIIMPSETLESEREWANKHTDTYMKEMKRKGREWETLFLCPNYPSGYFLVSTEEKLETFR